MLCLPDPPASERGTFEARQRRTIIVRMVGEQPWRAVLLRALQSWRDTAAAASTDGSLDERTCAACASNRYLVVAQHGEQWPHWMQHSLAQRLDLVRIELLQQVDPDGLPNASDVQFVELWLRHAVESIDSWPVLARRAAARSAQRA